MAFKLKTLAEALAIFIEQGYGDHYVVMASDPECNDYRWFDGVDGAQDGKLWALATHNQQFVEVGWHKPKGKAAKDAVPIVIFIPGYTPPGK